MIPIKSVIMLMKTKDRPDTLIVCITGDIDDFQKESPNCLNQYFSVLHKYHIKGTFFITAKAAEEYPERVEYILKHRYLVEGHGDVHRALFSV